MCNLSKAGLSSEVSIQIPRDPSIHQEIDLVTENQAMPRAEASHGGKSPTTLREVLASGALSVSKPKTQLEDTDMHIQAVESLPISGYVGQAKTTEHRPMNPPGLRPDEGIVQGKNQEPPQIDTHTLESTRKSAAGGGAEGGKEYACNNETSHVLPPDCYNNSSIVIMECTQPAFPRSNPYEVNSPAYTGISTSPIGNQAKDSNEFDYLSRTPSKQSGIDADPMINMIHCTKLQPTGLDEQRRESVSCSEHKGSSPAAGQTTAGPSGKFRTRARLTP